jgi:hypothetical protein
VQCLDESFVEFISAPSLSAPVRWAVVTDQWAAQDRYAGEVLGRWADAAKTRNHKHDRRLGKGDKDRGQRSRSLLTAGVLWRQSRQSCGPRTIAALFLIWALFPNPYGYYVFVRIVVCGVCGYAAYCDAKMNRQLR